MGGRKGEKATTSRPATEVRAAVHPTSLPLVNLPSLFPIFEAVQGADRSECSATGSATNPPLLGTLAAGSPVPGLDLSWRKLLRQVMFPPGSGELTSSHWAMRGGKSLPPTPPCAEQRRRAIPAAELLTGRAESLLHQYHGLTLPSAQPASSTVLGTSPRRALQNQCSSRKSLRVCFLETGPVAITTAPTPFS